MSSDSGTPTGSDLSAQRSAHRWLCGSRWTRGPAGEGAGAEGNRSSPQRLCWNLPVDNDAIREAALQIAASKGDPDPASIECVREASRVQTVTLFSGGGVSEDQDQLVMAVHIRGSFVGRGAKPPWKSNLPAGSVLKVEMDSAGRVLDWGIDDQVADLTQLGEVVRLR